MLEKPSNCFERGCSSSSEPEFLYISVGTSAQRTSVFDRERSSHKSPDEEEEEPPGI